MIYLDNAATTFPKPGVVIDKVKECMGEWCANPGRSGHDMAMKSGDAVYEARKRTAQLLNADSDEIIFTSNCTDALNTAFHGILKPGDHVVTTMMEHNSVLRPLKALSKRGVETTIVRCDSYGYPVAGAIRSSCRENTKMIVCTMASNVTGTIMPIEEISKVAKEKGILFLVDGSQGLGVLETDVRAMGIDLLAASGHKSLFGPQGTGFLYVKKGVQISPLKEGGTGSESHSVIQPAYIPEGFEAGTVNVPGIAGLAEGIKFVLKQGIGTIKKHEEELIKCMEEETEGIPGIIKYGPRNIRKRVGIFSFNLRGMNSERTAEILNREFQIAVRAGFHCAPYAHNAIGTRDKGCVRMSVSAFNTMEEMMTAARALKDIENKYRI